MTREERRYIKRLHRYARTVVKKTRWDETLDCEVNVYEVQPGIPLKAFVADLANGNGPDAGAAREWLKRKGVRPWV